MHYILPICVLTYHIAKYLDRLFAEKDIVAIEKNIIAEKKAQYVVNDKNIHLSHFQYYIQILGLQWGDAITDDIINIAFEQRVKEITRQDDGLFIIDTDVISARSYLLDQWNYIVWQN